MHRDAGSDYTWRAHPARERVGIAMIGVLVILAMAGLTGELMQSVLWAGFAALTLLLFLNRFFFPSRFVIDDEGITARYPLRCLRLPWKELRRFDHDHRGGFLSTRARHTWRDARRGMLVLFGGREREVIEQIRARLPEGVGVWAH